MTSKLDRLLELYAKAQNSLLAENKFKSLKSEIESDLKELDTFKEVNQTNTKILNDRLDQITTLTNENKELKKALSDKIHEFDDYEYKAEEYRKYLTNEKKQLEEDAKRWKEATKNPIGYAVSFKDYQDLEKQLEQYKAKYGELE